ncbi:MAG: hypothetical protein H7Z14_06965 [Anaerolineae bacterium]|nr:hypothetical protein [Phycisphaerae bacterium]
MRAPAFVVFGLLSIPVGEAPASFVPVYGADVGGAGGNPYLPFEPGRTAGDGLGIGSVYRATPTPGTLKSFRWGPNGTVELSAPSFSRPYGINKTGMAVGTAGLPVRWDESGVVTELGHLGDPSTGSTTGIALTINDAGASAGWVLDYVDDQPVGNRAVRWDAGHTTATALDHISTDLNGHGASVAVSINAHGLIAGNGQKYVNGVDRGTRAVRWAASGTEATELGILGTSPSGNTNATVYRVNDSGTAVGYCGLYDGTSSSGKRVPARWDGSGAAATPLLHPDGVKSGYAFDVNNAGTAVGWVEEYVNTFLTFHAMRWDPGQNVGIPLRGLTNPNAETAAHAINDSGIVVGLVYDAGGGAFMWLPDGTPVRLNSLIDPASGWSLYSAIGISDTNWVTGYGVFDPDGAGGVAGYDRMFIIQVPEPRGIAATCMCALARLSRGHRRRLYAKSTLS